MHHITWWSHDDHMMITWFYTHGSTIIWFMYVLWHILGYHSYVHFDVLFRYVFGWYLYDKNPVYKWHIEIVWNSNVCDNDASDFLYSQGILAEHLVRLLKTKIIYRVPHRKWSNSPPEVRLTFADDAFIFLGAGIWVMRWLGISVGDGNYLHSSIL